MESLKFCPESGHDQELRSSPQAASNPEMPWESWKNKIKEESPAPGESEGMASSFFSCKTQTCLREKTRELAQTGKGRVPPAHFRSCPQGPLALICPGGLLQARQEPEAGVPLPASESTEGLLGSPSECQAGDQEKKTQVPSFTLC